MGIARTDAVVHRSVILHGARPFVPITYCTWTVVSRLWETTMSHQESSESWSRYRPRLIKRLLSEGTRDGFKGAGVRVVKSQY